MRVGNVRGCLAAEARQEGPSSSPKGASLMTHEHLFHPRENN